MEKLSYFNLQKYAQYGQPSQAPPNPRLVNLFNMFRSANLNVITALSPGDSAELENMQFQIRNILRKTRFPQNRIRN